MKDLKHLDDKPISPLYRFIRWAVWKLSPAYTLVGTENLPEGACIIVGNHSQMYGPIAGELYIPGKHSTWCAGEMMHRREVAEYAYRDFWSGKPKAVRWLYRLFSLLIPLLSQLVFTNAHTIPVYHDTRLMTTLRESLARLQEGEKLVIFPERAQRYSNILYAFQDKFIDVARLYRKKTGRELDFVPLYLAPALKTMTFGPPVRFRGEEPMAAERSRICRTLMEEITRMALAQPEHRVVPYANLPKRLYPKSHPLEVYDEEAR
ncbi:MAG: hypothetical protein IKG89_01815 [Oscillospiraceae bacterium]|nr:hypothetical protein [Oscillospiraceae bacterium]